eukprot:GFKZ01010717.1.p1 GENE.GFKZ01010717.1~~GFKZ01010717.1.p1  ORF type:complete len:171 (-),score=10.48 GFKZ01010717.1:460-972(-)
MKTFGEEHAAKLVKKPRRGTPKFAPVAGEPNAQCNVIVMLYRLAGVAVFDDTAPLECAECHKIMDHVGIPAADLFSKDLGWNNRHKAVANVLGKEPFTAAGIGVNYEVGVDYEVEDVVPGLNARPADILMQSKPNTTRTSLLLPMAYDVTIFSRIQERFRSMRRPAERKP